MLEKKFISLIVRKHQIDSSEAFTQELFELIETNNNVDNIDQALSSLLNNYYRGFEKYKNNIIELLHALNEIGAAWWQSDDKMYDHLVYLSRMSGNKYVQLIQKDTDDDIFNELCKLSAEENWCYNIFCTTCGHMNYRYAFKELANGLRPSDPFWDVSKDRMWKIHSKYSNLVDDTKLNFNEQLELAQIVSKTSISRLFEDISNSDIWLGTLGLVLYEIGNNQEAIELLTRSLTPQFLNLDIFSTHQLRYALCKSNDKEKCSEFNPLSWQVIDKISNYI